MLHIPEKDGKWGPNVTVDIINALRVTEHHRKQDEYYRSLKVMADGAPV
jgi:hypothetical protein